MRVSGRIEVAGAVAVVLALTLSAVTPVEAARSGEFRGYDEPQDDWWNTCPYTGPCDDSPRYRIPKPPKFPKFKPPPAPELPEFRLPRSPTTWVKIRYEGPGSKPSISASAVPSTLPTFAPPIITFPEAPAEKAWDRGSLSKKKPGVYRSKNGMTVRVRVSRIAAPEDFRKMKAYNEGARRWNDGRQRGFTGGYARKPDPLYGGGVGWKKAKATPYRSRTVGFIPTARLGQAISAIASYFASALNGEPTVVKVGPIKKPKAARDRKASRNVKKAQTVGG